MDLRENIIDKRRKEGEENRIYTDDALFVESYFAKTDQKWCRIMRGKKVTFVSTFTLIFLFLTAYFLPSACGDPYTASYFPSGHNLLGSTAHVSGSLADLQADDGIYMTYQAYPSAFSSATNTRAFISYRSNSGTNLLNSPKGRAWNGSVWDISETELSVAGSPVRGVRTAVCPKSGRALEKIVVTLSDDGYLDAYAFDGVSWNVTNNIGQVWTSAPADARRPYDVGYESSSGDALLVYGTTVAGGANDLAYRVWSFGSGWGSEQYYDDIGHATKVTVTYVVLASDANSDKIGMAYIDSTNSDANAVIWNGSSWGGSVEITGTVAITTEECVAIASESGSGAFMAVAGEGQFITWARYTTSWSTVGIFDINSGATSAMNWLKLSSSSDNRLMLTSVDEASDLCTAVWDGGSIGNRQWSTTSESIGSMTSSTSVTSMRFTAQASKSVTHILVYIHAVAASPSYRFGIETSTTGYLPNGTYVGGASNYAVLTPTATGWLNLTLPSSASLTAGTVYHITVRYNSGTIGSSNYIALRRMGTVPNKFHPRENTIDPWLNTIFGTTIQNYDPVFIIKYSDGTYESMPYDTPAAHNIYGAYWFSEKWMQNVNQTIFGVNVPLAKSGTPADSLYIVIRNETDSQDVATITLPQADITTTLQWYEKYFASPISLIDGKDYRLILRSPSSTSTNYFICRSLLTGQLGGFTYDGTNSIYSSSMDSGSSWTDTNERDLTYVILSNVETVGWIVHTPWDSAVDTNAQRCADFSWEYRSVPAFRNQGLLVYGTTAGQITWRRFRAPNYMTTATNVITGANVHPWVQLKSNTRDVAGDIKVLGAILEGGAALDLGAIKWDGATFTVIGAATFTADTTVFTYECFDLEFQMFGDPTEFTSEVEFTGTSNTETWTQLAWTVDSSFTTDSVTMTLQLYNYQTGSYPTSGEGYITDIFGTTDITKTQNITANPMHFRDSLDNWKMKLKGVKSTSAYFNFKLDLVKFEVIYVDVNSPAWSNAGANNTMAGQPTLFYVKWTDNFGLSGFIFGINNTGTWTNDTWIPMSGATNWSNVTKILNNTPSLVQWRVWANDTSNNWNDTGIFSLTVLHLPVASFTYSPLAPYTGEIVTFNASASYDPDGTIVSYSWNFGDGTNGTGGVATHAYADNGVYTVMLTITDNDGLTDTETQSLAVLNRPPIASFTESATSVPTGTTIYFNASSSYDPDGFIVSYLWDFGDGTNGTGVTIGHAYADNGTYTVMLTVTDEDGATAVATATKIISNRPPVASFTESATTIYTGEVIYFNASASYDLDGSIASYFWAFGDGTNATGVIVSHIYADNGTYNVTLTVTDNDGATSTAVATKTVLNRPPVASFTESATVVYTGEVITFNASGSYDPDGAITSYFWVFDDGTNATGLVVTHAYSDNGTYVVTLTVTDNDGATAIQTATKTVLNRPPIASFTKSATMVFTGEVIYFNASASYDLDGSIVSYFWNFGDGTNATGVTASHAYAENGNYTVTLTITDDDGATSIATAIMTVLNRPPVASFTESAETVYTGVVITFNASSSYDPDGSIVSYRWDFGDGNITTVTTRIITHVYVDNGTYTVTLTVIDNDGATASASSTKTVLNRSPVAAFTYSPSIPYTGQTITFNATGSYDPDGSVVGYRWDFGDGNVTTGINPIITHVYADNGTYAVILTVTDNDGAQSVTSASITVLNRPPVASFTESATTVFTAEVISFDASASYDPDGSVISYFWNFGDGSNATGVTVSHAYSDNGVYTVTLTVTDNDGAIGTATATKTVLNRPPFASFSENATTVLTGVAIRFNASSSYDLDGTIVSFFWNFGDGTNATGMVVDHAYLDDGVYTVTLKITDNDGATATSNATKTILNRSPVASFTESAETVYTGGIIIFNASSSYDPDGTIVNYWWNFGDGTNATGVTVSHAYADNGTYMVTLTVTDNDGATASESAIKTILNRSPVVIFTESAETVVVGQVIYFNASQSYDSDGSIVSYYWNFGDGTNATGVTVEHAYADNGVYIVTLTITDDDGATASASAIKTVEITHPVAVFTESAEIVYTGEVITFNASGSYDSDGYIVSYFWTFGDGTNATGVIVTHTYANNGSYTVTLTVTDDDGATGTATAAKTVLNRPPIASFAESATTVYTGEIIYFNASGSYDSDGIIVSYFWNFGDGFNATGIVTQHSYAENGAYAVILTITDDDGATSTATATKTVLNRPPNASFTYTPSFPVTSETVTFNASESYDIDGTITSYAWDFGDGNITTTTNPILMHAYASYGNYTVTLTITDNDGATAITTKTATVRGYPIANFSYTPAIPYNNKTVTFDASTSDPRGGFIASYFWNFGDGYQLNTTDAVVTHVYTAVGDYTVTLIVTDSEGLSDSTSKVVTVVDVPPMVSFTYTPTYPAVNQTIALDASTSYDPNGYVVSYVWNFGDGNVTSTTDPIIYHKYSQTGNYTVRLTVADNGGLTNTTSKVVTVNPPPQANFDYTPEYPYLGDVVSFNASSSTAGNKTIASYIWDFGDGSSQVNETDPIATHIYTKAGNFTARLTITDSDGLTSTVTKPVTILKAPIAVFVYSPASPQAFNIVTFNASDSYDPNGHIVSYVWDFGDGNVTTVTTPAITHYYATKGNYTVVLIVSDNNGYTDSVTKLVAVSPSPPTADFIYTPNFPIVGETATFNASNSYDIDGTVVNYTWNFGDGNTTTTSSPTITHIYSTYGNYTVVLAVTDNDGLAGNKTSAVMIRDYPTANFTVSPEVPNVNTTATFNASLSTANGGAIVSYLWSFGDGSQLNTTNTAVTHVYVAVGNYTVTLTVTDSEGLNATASKIVHVAIKPTANFTYFPSNPYVGDTITFNASSSYDLDGSIVGYVWNFGDGSPLINTTGPVTTHIYAIGGNYFVVLRVVDNEGLDGTTSRLISVNKAPVAIFTYSPGSPIAGDVVTFNASQSYDARRPIANYTWNFGDGNVTTTINPIITHVYAAEGSYIAKLTVVDTGGYNDTYANPITIRNYPIADFAPSPSYPIKDQRTTFDASPSQPRGGIITIYFWNFGDGSTLSTTYPTADHTFTAVGEYNVTLTVTDSEGLSGTTSKIVKVRDYPTADFTWSPSSPVATERIAFNASLSTANSGTIITYIWDFGDGSPILTTSSPILEHAYSRAQNYDVTLTILNSEGLSSSTTKTVTVLKAPPTASFIYAPEILIANQTIAFNATASRDPDGYIASYTWDFGDGNILITYNPLVTHVYGSIGNYTVKLSVTDNDGLSTWTTKTVELVTHPTVEFYWAPLRPQSTTSVVFNASSSQANSGVIVSYAWDFGDGNITTTTSPITTHSYAFYGNYSVTLTVLNSEGLSSNKTQILTVDGFPPEANFTWSPTIPQPNATVTFNASLSIPNGGVIVFYEWDFGDGTSSGITISKTVAHEYAVSGSYTVTLRVTDSEKMTGTVSKIVTVGDSPFADFMWSPQYPQAYETVTFDASSSTPNGGTIVNYAWDFGDGNVTESPIPIIAHYYTMAGDYLVTLNVTDSEGFWTALSKTITVLAPQKPQVDFTWSPVSPYVNETISFNASTSTPNGGVIISYAWNFGDGNVTTTSNAIISHVYVLASNYTVTLNVTDSQGLWSTKSQTIEILPPSGPTANFAWNPSTPRPNQTITFDASNSIPGWNGTHHPPIVSYVWDFGDGNVTITTNPIIYHVYTAEGNYTITLTVVNSNGAEDSLTQVVSVGVRLIGDVNGDGIVNMVDIYQLILHFMCEQGDPDYIPHYDLNSDGIINMQDIYMAILHFMEQA